MKPNPPVSRRDFLSRASLAAGAVLASGSPALGATPTPPPRKALQLAVSSYSYWHFRSAKVPIETVIEKAAALGVTGVDILHRQMDIPERAPLTPAHRASLQKLKRHA